MDKELTEKEGLYIHCHKCLTEGLPSNIGVCIAEGDIYIICEEHNCLILKHPYQGPDLTCYNCDTDNHSIN